MKKQFIFFSAVIISLGLASCKEVQFKKKPDEAKGKVVVYQVLPRLFGNQDTTNRPWGTKEENGVGRFRDFTPEALIAIKNLGTTHIWYTGVLHHALVGDYTKYGISNDDPDVVKGRAGSPYAVKDYYNVNPDLAEDPANRMEEFDALIDRTHEAGMKVIIDIIPNHVARKYESTNMPDSVSNLGANDDTSVEYARNNNFYYIPGESFVVPEPLNNYQVLGGEKHALADGTFDENPAKWTGNGARKAQPHFYDWYETVKINYRIKPDGSKDFDTLPQDYASKDYVEHFKFWQGKDVPDSWKKFRDIALFWMDKGVDGFRYDMAEMVPVEFWSYMNSSIKMKNPDAFILAEVYNPSLYRDYIHLGKMDYLYDKVALYDTLKNIMQGRGSCDHIAAIQENLADIEHHMLHFLENHDEQRIASAGFAGNAKKGKPAMVVSTCISTSPTMLYFGQNVGEAGNGNPGFGSETRTTIFDYWGVPNHQRWMNQGTFDGAQLTKSEKELNHFYKTLLSFSRESEALNGEYAEIHSFNREQNPAYSEKLFSFVRWSNDKKLLIISNFSDSISYSIPLQIPQEIAKKLSLENKNYLLKDALSDQVFELKKQDGTFTVDLRLEPLESFILQITPVEN